MCNVLVLSRFWMVCLLTLVGVLHAGGIVWGEDGPVTFDFCQPGGERGWTATHEVALTPSSQGLHIQITGSDPYLTGPLFQTPPAGRAIVRMAMNSDTGTQILKLTGPVKVTLDTSDAKEAP